MSNERKLRIGLIYGGQGRESDVSIRGMKHILPLFDRNEYEIIPVFIEKGGRWLICDEEVCLHSGGFFCPDTQKRYELDCAIPLLHGDFGEDGKIQGALECAGVSYVGCDSTTGAVCRDKALVKMIAVSLGIPTLPFLLLLRCEGMNYAVRRAEESFSYPMFVKPTNLGSSVGVSRAGSRSELTAALKLAFDMTDRVIVEPYISSKRELECGYFSTKSKEIFTNPGEILYNGLYGYDEKYLSDAVGIAVRADVSDSVRESAREYSRRLVRTLGVRDLSRIDFFLSGDRLYFNEINTMPGFTDGSLYAKMIETEGIGESRLFSMLIKNSIERA